jgi:hypothetical protein
MAATATARLPRARGLGGMGPFLFAAAATGVWALTLAAYAVGLAAIILTALVVHPRGRG